MFLDTVPDRPIKDTKTERRFSPPLLLIKEHENLHHGLWNGHYLTYKHEIVGLAAPKTDPHHLAAIEARPEQIGRAAWRERVGPTGQYLGVGVNLKKTKKV